MRNKGVPLENKGVARLLLRENKCACPTCQVCIERESVPTVTPVLMLIAKQPGPKIDSKDKEKSAEPSVTA